MERPSSGFLAALGAFVVESLWVPQLALRGRDTAYRSEVARYARPGSLLRRMHLSVLLDTLIRLLGTALPPRQSDAAG